MDVSQFFIHRRFDRATHLGQGDVRLTFADQEKIIEHVNQLRASLRECLKSLEVCEVWAPGRTQDYIAASGRKDRARALLADAAKGGAE